MCKLHITRNGFSFFYDVLCFFRKRILRDTIRIFNITARIYTSYHIIYNTCILKIFFIKNIRIIFTFSRYLENLSHAPLRISLSFSLFLSLILHCMFFFTIFSVVFFLVNLKIHLLDLQYDE